MNDDSPAPKKKAYRKQTTRIQVRMTPDTHDKIKAICEASGVSMSELIRTWAEKRNITAKADVQQYNQLRQLGGLLKHTLQELRAKKVLDASLHASFEEALKGITQATSAIIKEG